MSCEDLADDDRWAEFSTEAVAAGMRAVLVSPIPFASDAIGVVAVFSTKSHVWTPEGELALMSFTDLAALVIAATMQSEERGKAATSCSRPSMHEWWSSRLKGFSLARTGSIHVKRSSA